MCESMKSASLVIFLTLSISLGCPKFAYDTQRRYQTTIYVLISCQGHGETAVVLTVPDFPACRPLTETAKLLLYSTNKPVSTSRMSPLCTPAVVAKVCPHLPHRCPSPTPPGGFSEDECSCPSFSPNHPHKAVWLAASASEQGNPAEPTAVTFLKSFFHQLLLCPPFSFRRFGAKYNFCFL